MTVAASCEMSDDSLWLSLRAGNNSPQLSPPTGAPAMTVPMGFAVASNGVTKLPASLQFLARPFDEANLIRAAYSYEQATKHRRSVQRRA